MNYTIIKKNQHTSKPEISISKNMFLLNSGFRDTYGAQRYVQFAYDDDGMLCFKLTDDKEPDTYCVLKTKGNAYICRPPRTLLSLFPLGTYSVDKRDDWFVTNCKKQ